MSGQFQLRTAGGEYALSVSTYHCSAYTAGAELTTTALPCIQVPPNSRKSDG